MRIFEAPRRIRKCHRGPPGRHLCSRCVPPPLHGSPQPVNLDPNLGGCRRTWFLLSFEMCWCNKASRKVNHRLRSNGNSPSIFKPSKGPFAHNGILKHAVNGCRRHCANKNFHHLVLNSGWDRYDREKMRIVVVGIKALLHIQNFSGGSVEYGFRAPRVIFKCRL